MSNKFGAKVTTVDGIKFHSIGEARRYETLKFWLRVGAISKLEFQPAYICLVGGIKIGKYVADFRYLNDLGEVIVEDFKGFDTPLSKWKRKHVEAQYGIKIIIVKK